MEIYAMFWDRRKYVVGWHYTINDVLQGWHNEEEVIITETNRRGYYHFLGW